MILLASAILLQTPETGKLLVPAFTGYPSNKETRVDEKGMLLWEPFCKRVRFVGNLVKGRLDLKINGGANTFRVSIDGKATTLQNRELKSIQIANTDYRFIDVFPEGIMSKSWLPQPVFQGIELSGPATVGAKFNLKERRNAPSVHLKYPLQPDEKVEWFYNEIRPQTDNPATYYQACGFHRGYFGIQVNSPTERRVIFSVWDSGDVPDDRAKVKKEDLVQCLEKGKDVVAEGFGNEGTGGHSHLVYNWKTKDVHRFLVHAQPDGDKTIYSGYYWFNETKKWGLIAKFRAPKDGSYMKASTRSTRTSGAIMVTNSSRLDSAQDGSATPTAHGVNSPMPRSAATKPAEKIASTTPPEPKMASSSSLTAAPWQTASSTVIPWTDRRVKVAHRRTCHQTNASPNRRGCCSVRRLSISGV